MARYLSRIIDAALKRALSERGAVLIQGPRWCGKTTAAKRYAKSFVDMADPEARDYYALIARADPSGFLKGRTPRLISEWQSIPFIWDDVRREADRRKKPGQLILTGSSAPDDTSEIRHCGRRQIARLRMRTMSLFETGDSTGTVSLQALFEGQSGVSGRSDKTLRDIAQIICRGGWPKSIREKNGSTSSMAAGCLKEILKASPDDGGLGKDERRMSSLLRAYARHVSTPAGITTLQQDMAKDGAYLSRATIRVYLDLLRRHFLIEEQRAWDPSLKSHIKIKRKEVRHLADPSLATAALEKDPEGLLRDMPLFERLFKSLCVHDLRVYFEAMGGEVRHYSDETGLEVDAIVELPDSRYGLMKITLGTDPAAIGRAAKDLLKLRRKLDLKSMPEPSFLMVLTAGGRADRRDDGVLVVPIACLRD